MLLVTDMKNSENQPKEGLSPHTCKLNFIEEVFCAHNNTHSLQGGKAPGQWLPVVAHPALSPHCVLAMTPQNQRGERHTNTHTHTHQGVLVEPDPQSLGVHLCVKKRIYPHGAACAAFRVWLSTPCHLEWEDTVPCDAGLIILVLCLFLDFPVVNPSPWAGVWSCHFSMCVIPGGVTTNTPSCVSRRAPFFTKCSAFHPTVLLIPRDAVPSAPPPAAAPRLHSPCKALKFFPPVSSFLCSLPHFSCSESL